MFTTVSYNTSTNSNGLSTVKGKDYKQNIREKLIGCKKKAWISKNTTLGKALQPEVAVKIDNYNNYKIITIIQGFF